LEDREDKNNKMPRKVWKAVKAKSKEVRMAEAKRGRKKERRIKEIRRKGTEE